MPRRLVFMIAIFSSALAYAGSANPRIIAFASNNWLRFIVGKYDPAHGWVQGMDFFEPPEPGATFTIVGMAGKLGEAPITPDQKTSTVNSPLGWTVPIPRGRTESQPYALAIEGSWPKQKIVTKKLPLDDPRAIRIASEFLKRHHLNVESPLITEAYEVDLLGNGTPDILLCAHNDQKAVRDNEPAAIYAVALIHSEAPGHEKTFEIASQTSYKPASQSIADHLKYYGVRDFYRLIALYDFNGDGHQEIGLYRAKEDSTEADVFTFDGHEVKEVLSTDKPNYT